MAEIVTKPDYGQKLVNEDGQANEYFQLYLDDIERILNNTSIGRGIPDAVLRDQKSPSVDGGAFNSGAWRIRTMNTFVRNTNNLISISSPNAFTVGNDGWVAWAAPANGVFRHQTRLFNVTDTAVVEYGSSAATSVDQTDSIGGGAVESTKTYRIEHQCSDTMAVNGFGVTTTFGAINVYTQMQYWSE